MSMSDLPYRRRINLVVFGMDSNEAHEPDPTCIVETHDEAIPVPADINVGVAGERGPALG